MSRYRVQRIGRWLLLPTVILILYGSLFPFHFWVPGAFDLATAFANLHFQPTSRGDIVANILLYLPIGFCLALAWPARRRRTTMLLCSVAAGTLLSLSVEVLQVYSIGRVSSLTDVLINAIGTLAGALIVIFYFALGRTLAIPGIPAARPEPVPLSLLALWLGFRLAPFVPTIDLQKYKDAVKPLFIDPHFGGVDVFRYLVGWLVVSYAVCRIWRREYGLFAFFGLIAVVQAGRIAIVGKTLVASELFALVLCLPLALILATLPERRGATLLAMLLAANIILAGLAPFEFMDQAKEFSWMPFKSSLSDNLELNYSVLLEKSFWYSALIWLLARHTFSIWSATFLTAALLGGIELAQLWLPGRVAETTDPLLAIAAGVLLFLADGGRAER